MAQPACVGLAARGLPDHPVVLVDDVDDLVSTHTAIQAGERAPPAEGDGPAGDDRRCFFRCAAAPRGVPRVRLPTGKGGGFGASSDGRFGPGVTSRPFVNPVDASNAPYALDVIRWLTVCCE
ncbi:hypothetical protein GCM10010451_41150 [Streptomyces virens]|uniref:Uncharacterized protein n=1 Tax=Streptomyces virens TaxID=285572 RepID=A0ABP6PS90_9ACTN